jgi:hypothetical protein
MLPYVSCSLGPRDSLSNKDEDIVISSTLLYHYSEMCTKRFKYIYLWPVL